MVNILSDISFIIIALNEDFAMEKCLSSLSKMKLSNCEIICIDSNSTDNTVSVIKKFRSHFEDFRSFLIKGYSNPAIARNIGIKSASKNALFFVDGDVELCEDFIFAALNKIETGYDAVLGNLKEYQYREDYSEVLRTIDRTNIKQEIKVFVSGGCFITRRNIAEKVGLFDEKFERSQDIEYTLRLTRHFKMIAIPQFMGIHHTISYENKKRITKSLYRFHYWYFGMIVRRNILNYNGLFYCVTTMLQGIMGGFILWIICISTLFLIQKPINYMIIASIFFIDILYGKIQKKDFIYRIVLHYIAPFYLILGLVFDIDFKKDYTVVEIFE